MIELDGSVGEGGGQILRTALGLSLVTGSPFRIANVRAGRERPGLMRQHLTAVEAATKVGDARVTGAGIGSMELTFEPKAVRPGRYSFAVGTAGSTTLVLQTVLPALLTASGSSTLELSGGTHNPFAPPFDFIDRVFLPIVRRMGPQVRAHLERPGFYPAGGGRFTVEVEPVRTLSPIEILERGDIVERRATAIVAGVPESVAERELRVVERKLGWDPSCLVKTVLPPAFGPGNVLMLEVHSSVVGELCTGFGERDVRAEGVAHHAIDEMRHYLGSQVPVGVHLADQLLIPVAMAGAGAFRTMPLSRHARTNVDVVNRFLQVDVAVSEEPNRSCVVKFGVE
ncbi:MAG: RNA 3'-terminal phosphate cyclase [Planctomycetes bacterium]|nr:RNA 3'-terminal phosphate cyclase [Planctomycetota bacterium]MBI3845601.1 RNA 3'-terminal phosphate cyclase [Planctomycetota bacterium]